MDLEEFGLKHIFVFLLYKLTVQCIAHLLKISCLIEKYVIFPGFTSCPFNTLYDPQIKKDFLIICSLRGVNENKILPIHH